MATFFKAMDISSSALAAQRLRMNILSTNLANSETTRTPDGGPYRRQDVVFTATPTGSPFEDFLDDSLITQLKKVRVTEIHQDMREPKKIFNPAHPDADKEGIVSLPNISLVNEMVNMIAATRSYEANATALSETKQMAMKALEIGR